MNNNRKLTANIPLKIMSILVGNSGMAFGCQCG